MIVLGIALFSLTALLLLYRFFSQERPFRFPFHGYFGIGVLVAAELFLWADLEPVPTYFTPIAWTGYIFWTDAAVFALRGESLWKSHRAEFVWLAFCSIPLWLLFEAYNLRLENWIYVGLPRNPWERNFGYAWAFATIWPAIFETATLLRALGLGGQGAAPATGGLPRPQPAPPGNTAMTLAILLGAIFLIVPIWVPARIGAYLFGAVWLGFIFLLEPLNHRSGAPSLWRDIRHKDFSRLLSLLAAGWVCGIFWEFWNYWAAARWVYIFPIAQDWKLFAMPLPGYLGFPPFAVECFVLFAFLAPRLTALRAKSAPQAASEWAALRL